MTMGLPRARSAAQLEVVVRFVARVIMREVQWVKLDAQEASRSWVVRRGDLVVWKKDVDVWRKRENGKHDLNVLFARNPLKKFGQL
jgi:hypothetical protein